MTRPSGLAKVSVAAGTLAPLRTIIENAGLDCNIIFERAQLPNDLLLPGSTYLLSLADYFRLIEQIALAVGDETVHVSVRPLMLGTSDFIRDRLREATTAQDMLDILATSYNVIHGDRYNRVTLARDELAFVMDDSDFPYALPKDDPFVLFSLEALLVYVHVLLQSSSEDERPLLLRGIRTRRKRDGESPLAQWGVPLIHGAKHFALHYDVAIADWPVDPATCPVLGSRTIYGGIARTLGSIAPPAGEDIAERTAQALRDGVFDQLDVARQLGMSVPSLRRRLGERSTSFREIRSSVLCETARQRLESGASVATVAEELDFSDGRSFARAFRGWTGQSPSEYQSATRKV